MALIIPSADEKLVASPCDSCGYVHLMPMPTTAELDRRYTHEYYQTLHPERYAKERREWWYWRKVYEARLERFRDLKPLAWRIVDVGSSHGWFLRAARGKGWQARGVELSLAVQGLMSDLGLEVRTSLDEMPASSDAIHCCLFLEHVRDPLWQLEAMRDRLVPGGVLCAVVPNEFNPLQVQITERFGYSPVHEEHVNYFTKSSIVTLVERAGFTIVDVEATFPMEWFALRTPLNYVKWPWTGTVAHWVRMVFERVMYAACPDEFRQIRQSWARRGIGREVVVWAVKDDTNGRG